MKVILSIFYMRKAFFSLCFLINKDLISSGDFVIQGVQTAVFKYFVLKILDLLCNLVNQGFKVMISFVTDLGVISLHTLYSVFTQPL